MNAEQRAILHEWCDIHRCCAVCWWPESAWGRRLHVHHLVSGVNRAKAHDPKCYLRLCDRCHDVYHSGKVSGLFPDLNARILLTAKQESDPDNYNPGHLAALKAKRHLGYDPEPIPEFYIEERQRNLTRDRKA